MAKIQAEVDTQRIQADAEEKKTADEIRMAEIVAEEKKRTDEIQIQIAKVVTDKELGLKELKLQALTTGDVCEPRISV